MYFLKINIGSCASWSKHPSCGSRDPTLYPTAYKGLST